MHSSTSFNSDKDKNVKVERQPDNSQDRRGNNRRQIPCEGYVKIPEIGWYCRRMKIRRKDDSQR